MVEAVLLLVSFNYPLRRLQNIWVGYGSLVSIVVLRGTKKGLNGHQRHWKNIRGGEQRKPRKEKTRLKNLDSVSNADSLNIQDVSVCEDT